MKVKLCMCLAVAGSAAVHPAAAETQWSELKHVAQVQVVDHGGLIVYFDSALAQPCTPNFGNQANAVYVYPGQLGITSDAVKSITSLALTALSTGMRLKVWYDKDANYCWVQQAVIQK